MLFMVLTNSKKFALVSLSVLGTAILFRLVGTLFVPMMYQGLIGVWVLFAIAIATGWLCVYLINKFAPIFINKYSIEV